eukprot:scaffold1386_cov77-Cyclotella_meneghiniana.AAC.1
MRKEILHSLDEESLGVIPKKEDPDCPLKPPKCSFVSLCRLGVGTKPSTTGGSSSRHHSSRYSGGGSGHHDHHDGEFVLLDHDKNRIERHAKSHLHSFVRSDAVIKITDVPSYISHDQILVSMGKFGDKKEMQMYSSDVVIPTLSSDEKCDPYVRSVYVTFPSRESKENALDKLHRYNEDTGKIRSSHHHRRMPLELELEVDCSDVYGRKEVDADGYGGAPSKKVEMTRKSCRLMVSTVSLATSQPVSVLSAAVSSRTRIANDRKTVIELARQLDEVREITRGNRLNDLLRVLYPTENEWNSVDDEDVLDVSIAYLRRVHLFSFYNGCVMAESVGAVLAYGHPAGTIHLQNDAVAKQIEAAERETKNAWLENHGTMDEDGRARCSFHFCKKLFKDKAFLHKHLLKKHAGHLRSECAKCHDQAMMVAWDNDENRPVPPILIDCGAKFRKVPSAVIGSTEPIAHDPEPQLWKEEEERMAEEERLRKEAEEEERLAEEERERAKQRRLEAMAGDKRKGNFVDVDDMVEEKVELKMEDVVVAPPAKKKKKKKSLL